jgi:hypothetical protein
MRYKKKPVVIEAMQFNGSLDNAELINKWSSHKVKIDPIGDEIKLSVPTLEGNMTASTGDYIIRGVKGEYYPCKPDIFDVTYDKAEEGDFKTRLKDEHDQLEEKFNKLKSFVESGKFYELDKHNRALLSIQLMAMKTYLTCLNERIDLLGI